VPWFDHMITSPAVFPYSRLDVPRRTPPGTVPVTGGEADWGTGDPLRLNYAFDTLVANAQVNPIGPAEALARGDTLYQVFCTVCHGAAGAGDGPVGPRVAAPSLLTDKARALSDGYLYSIVRYGRGVMPLYGDKIHSIRDRWAVVNYVRTLQRNPAGAGGGTP
jgi:mono/diheme cytochrome c family protein